MPALRVGAREGPESAGSALSRVFRLRISLGALFLREELQSSRKTRTVSRGMGPGNVCVTRKKSMKLFKSFCGGFFCGVFFKETQRGKRKIEFRENASVSTLKCRIPQIAYAPSSDLAAENGMTSANQSPASRVSHIFVCFHLIKIYYIC